MMGPQELGALPGRSKLIRPAAVSVAPTARLSPGENRLHPCFRATHGQAEQLQGVDAAHRKSGIGSADVLLQQHGPLESGQRLLPYDPQPPGKSLDPGVLHQLGSTGSGVSGDQHGGFGWEGYGTLAVQHARTLWLDAVELPGLSTARPAHRISSGVKAAQRPKFCFS